MCEGLARLPLPGQLLQNLPAPTFHPFLKGQSLPPNWACPKPTAGEEKTRQGGRGGDQEALPGPRTQALRPFPGRERPQVGEEISTWASVGSSPSGSGVLLP